MFKKKQNDNLHTNQKEQLTEEQLKKNQEKINEYDRILKVAVTAIGIMFGIIVCIVAALVINNS